MLDHYSTAQKFAYGAGAFAFVFAAAMGGTLFMITGGFSDGGRSTPADPPALFSQAQAEPLFSESAASPPISYAQAPVSHEQAPPMGDIMQAMQVEPAALPLAPPAHAAAMAQRPQPGSIEIIGSTPPPMALRTETQEETEPPKSPDDTARDDAAGQGDNDQSPAQSGDKSSE